MTKIGLKEPFELKKRLHPALKDIPPLDPKGPEMDAIRAAIMQTGRIIEPVLLDSEGRVATDHGRMLVQAACDLGIDQIAYQETELDAATLILSELTLHRQLTKGAVAFLAYPLLETAWKASKARRSLNLAKWAKTPINVESALAHDRETIEAPNCKTVEDFAQEIGMSRRVFFEAQKVHNLFEDHEGKKFKFTVDGGSADGEIVESTLRDWFTPRIIRQPFGGEHESQRPMGLGAVCAACAYVISEKNFTGGKRPSHTHQTPEFWQKRIESLSNGFKNWDKTTDDVKQKALAYWAGNVRNLPEEILEATLREATRRLGQ